ncbi:hypothetical protein HDU78_010415 [Chytriomyces hyalinus]|nr:hypothetical protein HDU78_010415 [Chytriomyces hyalinus]
MSVEEVQSQIAFNNAIYGNINAGWNTVKIVGMTIIPYCYAILPSSFLWNTLMVGAMIDYLHCIMVFTAFTIPLLWPDADVMRFWIVQCICSALVRIVEIVYNAKLLQALQRGSLPIWQYVWFIVGSIGILFGRLYDTVLKPMAPFGFFEVRLGMIIVSTFSIFSSIPVIIIMSLELYEVYKKHKEMGLGARSLVVLQSAALRLIFLNAIDVGLIFQFLLPQSTGMPYVRWLFDNWDNSRLAYYAVDALLSKLSGERAASNTKQKSSGGGPNTGGKLTASSLTSKQ